MVYCGGHGPASLAPGILAALGGLPAEIAMDAGVMAATAPVLKAEALSGIQPEPF